MPISQERLVDLLAVAEYFKDGWTKQSKAIQAIIHSAGTNEEKLLSIFASTTIHHPEEFIVLLARERQRFESKGKYNQKRREYNQARRILQAETNGQDLSAKVVQHGFANDIAYANLPEGLEDAPTIHIEEKSPHLIAIEENRKEIEKLRERMRGPSTQSSAKASPTRLAELAALQAEKDARALAGLPEEGELDPDGRPL